MKRVFLEVRDLRAVATDLARSLFVPTLVPAHLTETIELVLRLPGARELGMLVRVVGRRLRSHSHLPAGVFVAAGDAHPVVEFLHDLAAGRVVDFEARLREHQRHPAQVRYRTRAEAQSELLGVLGDDGAVLNVGAVFGRGVKLALEVFVGELCVLNIEVVVLRLHIQDHVPGVVAVARDKDTRARVGAFINDEDRVRVRVG